MTRMSTCSSVWELRTRFRSFVLRLLLSKNWKKFPITLLSVQHKRKRTELTCCKRTTKYYGKRLLFVFFVMLTSDWHNLTRERKKKILYLQRRFSKRVCNFDLRFSGSGASDVFLLLLRGASWLQKTSRCCWVREWRASTDRRRECGYAVCVCCVCLVWTPRIPNPTISFFILFRPSGRIAYRRRNVGWKRLGARWRHVRFCTFLPYNLLSPPLDGRSVRLEFRQVMLIYKK